MIGLMFVIKIVVLAIFAVMTFCLIMLFDYFYGKKVKRVLCVIGAIASFSGIVFIAGNGIEKLFNLPYQTMTTVVHEDDNTVRVDGEIYQKVS